MLYGFSNYFLTEISKSYLLKEIVKRRPFLRFFWTFLLYILNRSLKPTVSMNRTKCCEIRYLTPLNQISRLILIKCNQFISLQIPARLHFPHSKAIFPLSHLNLVSLYSFLQFRLDSNVIRIHYECLYRKQAFKVTQKHKRWTGFEPAFVCREVEGHFAPLHKLVFQEEL